jgi:hypothetical protein
MPGDQIFNLEVQSHYFSKKRPSRPFRCRGVLSTTIYRSRVILLLLCLLSMIMKRILPRASDQIYFFLSGPGVGMSRHSQFLQRTSNPSFRRQSLVSSQAHSTHPSIGRLKQPRGPVGAHESYTHTSSVHSLPSSQSLSLRQHPSTSSLLHVFVLGEQ